MLREIGNIKQDPGQFFRRWFNDEVLDLFIWYDADERIAGFQLCFDKDGGRERALTYTEENGYTLNEVHADGSAWDMSSPVLSAAGAEFPRGRLLAQLAERGEALDRRVREYLTGKLEAYGLPSDVPTLNPEPAS